MTNYAGTSKNADPAFLLKFSFPKHNDTSEQILFASDNLQIYPRSINLYSSITNNLLLNHFCFLTLFPLTSMSNWGSQATNFSNPTLPIRSYSARARR